MTVEPTKGRVTQILTALGRGERDRAGELLDVVYGELHAMAQRQMARERGGATLQPTALVNEAYLRLLGSSAGGERLAFENRAHFFAAAGEAMRRILVEQARARAALKRGGDRQRIDLELVQAAAPAESFDHDDQSSGIDLVALNDALSRLEERDPRMATVVKLRFFAELSVDEIAAALGLSRRTVIRDWLAAKAWLLHALENPGVGGGREPHA